MSNPIVCFLGAVFGDLQSPRLDEKGKMNCGGKTVIVTTLLDAGLFITGLVVGILGVLSVIHMPVQCMYAGFGVSGSILTIWGAYTLLLKGRNLTIDVKRAFTLAFKKSPSD